MPQRQEFSPAAAASSSSGLDTPNGDHLNAMARFGRLKLVAQADLTCLDVTSQTVLRSDANWTQLPGKGSYAASVSFSSAFSNVTL